MVGSIWLDGTTVALIISTQVKFHICLSTYLECQSRLACAFLRYVCCMGRVLCWDGLPRGLELRLEHLEYLGYDWLRHTVNWERAEATHRRSNCTLSVSRNYCSV